MDTARIELLNNRYRLDAELGKGGMGSVYRAYDTLLDRTVAVKLLRERDEAGRDRLLREAKAAARLNHRHIVAVYDVGLAGEATYIVMEYVEGDSLDKCNHLGLAGIVAMAGQVAAALEHAHSHGIIHRDVKPENIMLTGSGDAKLMDFGLARPIASRITNEGALVGTVFYVAPEQALGKAIDGRADLYALGVMLYELVAGRLPFTAEDPLAVVSQHLYAPVVPPSTYNPDLPPVLESLILSLLNKQADDRPPSAALVREALAAMDLSTPFPRQAGAGLAGIARGRFVGRERELALCKAAWLEVAAGARRVVMIEGEPGVGKTRLAREVASQVAVLGGTVLPGECYAEGAAPYSPIGEAVRQAVAGDDSRSLHLPAYVLDDLAILTPGLRRAVRRQAAAKAGNPQMEFQRVCESLVSLFVQLSQRAPVMLLIEDLQWADSGTLCLLRHLAHRAHVADLRLLTLVTFRPVDSVQGRDLDEFLRELERAGGTLSIEVQPFARDETRRMLEVMFQREITDEFLDGIQQETGGNPFFVEEACKTLVAQGTLYLESGRWERGKSIAELGIPQNLRTAILARFARLSTGAQDVLRRASVIGREFDVAVLQFASDLSEEQLDACLEEAESAQFIHAASLSAQRGVAAGQRFAFAHALMPQAIATELGSIREARLHGRIGDALEQLYADRLDLVTAALGWHFAKAGKPAKAAEYLLRAGDVAQSVLAFEDAIHSYEQALPMLLSLQDHSRASQTHLKLGGLYHAAYRFEDSRCAYRQGFTMRMEPTDPGRTGSLGAESLPLAPHPLRVCWRIPESLDPCLATHARDHAFLGHLLSGLLEWDSENNLVPEVAWRWEMLENGKRYVFHLRDDWEWSDGVPVTAHDFEYAWKRGLDPKYCSPARELLGIIKGGRPSGPAGDPSTRALGVLAVDDQTLSVVLEEPAGYFLHMLTCANLFPVPRHIVEARGEKWADASNFVSNGAFRLEVGADGETWVLRRNPGYRGLFKGNVDQVNITLLRPGSKGVWNPDPRILALYDAERIDIAELDGLELQRARQHHSREEVSWQAMSTYGLFMNCRQPPLGDSRVRRALGMSLDLAQLVEDVWGEDATLADGGLVPPETPGHSPGIGLGFDPDEACRLLAEAGCGDGGRFPPTRILYPSDRENHEVAQHLVEQWKKVLGIRIAGEAIPWPAYLERHWTGDYDLTIESWIADCPDANSFLKTFISIHGLLNWNSEYERLVTEAAGLHDQQARLEKYAQADRLLCQQALFLPIVYGRGRAFIKPWIRRDPKWYNRGGCWKDVIVDPH